MPAAASVYSLGTGAAFRGAPRAARGSECRLALPSCNPGRAAPGQGSEHPDLIQVDISFPHCYFLLELSFLETCHTQGMSKPAALNPPNASDFLELAKGTWKPADRPMERRGHITSPGKFSADLQEAGTKGGGTVLHLV